MKLAYQLMSLLVLAVASLNPMPTNAKPIDDQQAAQAIVGEAANQGYLGMLAVACAIRNRGSLHGVRGLAGFKRMTRVSSQTLRTANQAWRDSIKVDVTFGATHWENVLAYGKPTWATNMVVTVIIKDHWFFKEKKTK